MPKKNIKQQILEGRGLKLEQPGKYKHKRLRKRSITLLEPLKTPLMRLLEMEHKLPIEDLIAYGTVEAVANQLKVNKSTISKWRKKLKTKWAEDNLPKCEGCNKATYVCTQGTCVLLLKSNQPELMQLKEDYPKGCI